MLGFPRQLTLAPMRLFSGWVKRPLNVSVQCAHEADARPAPMTFIATKTTESEMLFSVVHAKWNGR